MPQWWVAASSLAARPLLHSGLGYSLRGAARSYARKCTSVLSRPPPPFQRQLRQQQQQTWRFYSSGGGKAGPAPPLFSGYLVPIGVVGGVAAYFYVKKRAPVYCEAPTSAHKSEASMRLKLLHEQAAKLSQKMQAVRAESEEGKNKTPGPASLLAFIVRLIAPECWL
ncbi:hypothetical protein GGI21_002492, partial [Coemansia aciculifera]